MLEHRLLIQNRSPPKSAKWLRVARGFVAAALTPVFFGCLGAIYLLGWGEWVPLALFVASLIACIAGVVFTVVLGVPAYWILRRLKRHSLTAYLMAGAAISGIALCFVVLEGRGGNPNAAQDEFQRVFEIIALVSGPFAAWLFWRTVRPYRLE